MEKEKWAGGDRVGKEGGREGGGRGGEKWPGLGKRGAGMEEGEGGYKGNRGRWEMGWKRPHKPSYFCNPHRIVCRAM